MSPSSRLGRNTNRTLGAAAASAALLVLLTGCGGTDAAEGGAEEVEGGVEAAEAGIGAAEEEVAAESEWTPEPGEDSAAGGAAHRLLGIESCAEIEEFVAPLLTHGQTLTGEEITNTGYPAPSPYSFQCSYGLGDGDDTASLSVEAYADFDADTLDDLRQHFSEATEVATDLNAIVLEFPPPEHATNAVPNYLLELASPDAPYDAMTGSIRLNFNYDPHQLSEGMPDAAVIGDVLFSLLEPRD